MAIDNEGGPTTQFPEEVPQTIPELYLRLKARMDAGFGDVWKELSALKEEMRELRQEVRELRQEVQDVEQRLSEEIRQRYVDLRQRIERLQGSVNLMDNRFEHHAEEINYLRKSLRDLEKRVDPPLAA